MVTRKYALCALIFLCLLSLPPALAADAPPAPLTIEGAVAAALACSQELAQAREQSELAGTKVRADRGFGGATLGGNVQYSSLGPDTSIGLDLKASLTPKLTLTASYDPSNPAAGSNGSAGSRITLNYQPFAENAALEADLIALERARLNLAQISIAVELEARRLFLAALDAREEADLAATDLALAQADLEAAMAREEAGLAAASATMQARIAVQQAELALAAAVKEKDGAYQDLASCLGMDPAGLSLDDIGQSKPSTIDRAGLLAEALANDVPIKMAGLTLDDARNKLADARDNKPTLTCSLSVGEARDRVSATASASLSYNFAGKSKEQAIKEAAFQVEKAEAALAQAKQDEEKNIKSKADDLEQAMARINLLGLERDLSAQKLRETQARLDAGEITRHDLEKAEQDLARAEAKLRAGQRAVWLAWYALRAAVLA